MVIGWEKGDFSFESIPVFITNSGDTDKLVLDAYCINNLSKYLMEQTQKYAKKLGNSFLKRMRFIRIKPAVKRP